MRLHSEPRVCLGEDQNKEKEPSLKIASSETFSRNAFIVARVYENLG